jgi:hypothetical protein
VINVTFSNISAISWRPDLVVEEAGETYRPWASNWSTLSLASRVHPFFYLQRKTELEMIKYCQIKKPTNTKYQRRYIDVSHIGKIIKKRISVQGS